MHRALQIGCVHPATLVWPIAPSQFIVPRQLIRPPFQTRALRNSGTAQRPDEQESLQSSVPLGTLWQDQEAVIVVDHGSKRAEANAQLDAFVDTYRKAKGRRKVVAAHMELAAPSIMDAIASCVAEGYRDIVVAPYFLSQGRHIQQDIPRLVEEAQAAHPAAQIRLAAPIGSDPALADIVERRVIEARKW